MSYITRRPSARLAGVVERLWRVEDSTPSGAPETICPDGCAEIVIHLGEPMRWQPRHLLVGQMDAPLTVMSRGRVAMVGARLSPAGLHRLLPMPQYRHAGQIIALDTVWKDWTRRTADQVACAGDALAELDTFERALEVLVADAAAHRRDSGVEVALLALRRRGGPLSIEAMAHASNISRRQFERRFREHVGLSPNLFGRIVRFQHAFQALGHEPGAALAARLGFVDQAHLVREIRRFSGQTPTLLATADGLTSFFANPPSA